MGDHVGGLLLVLVELICDTIARFRSAVDRIIWRVDGLNRTGDLDNV